LADVETASEARMAHSLPDSHSQHQNPTFGRQLTSIEFHNGDGYISIHGEGDTTLERHVCGRNS
jgi:hypothetical protein